MTTGGASDAELSPPEPKRSFVLHVLPAVAWTILVFVGGGAHAPGPDVDWGFPVDKLQHVIGFAILQLFAYRALVYLIVPAKKPALVLAACGFAVGIGILLELYQLGLPHRSAELADVLADAAGAALGALVLARWS